MRIGFDIGGVISKYPEEFGDLIANLLHSESGEFQDGNFVCFITDMHPKEEVLKTLLDNGFSGEFMTNHYIWEDKYNELIFCADYEKHGNMAKAVLIRDLKLDIFIDDFDGYLQWDSSLGPQPILLKVMPDGFKPYWHESWKCSGNDFGRRKYVNDAQKQTKDG